MTWPPIHCPNCTSPVEGPEDPEVDCGKVGGDCRCPECGHRFAAPVIDYWVWLGLDTPPPD